jgi:hypothetical protein
MRHPTKAMSSDEKRGVFTYDMRKPVRVGNETVFRVTV